MGRVRAHTSPSPSRIRMRWSLVLLCVLLLVAISEGKSKKKPSKGKKPSKPGVKGRMRFWLSKARQKNTKKYTDTDKGKCACWWDITRNDCACCKKGVGAMQCGYPVHKFCYKRDKKNGYGCPGVCNYKHTLSGKGYPCFSDHENTNCAWCNKDGYQCKQDQHTGPDSKKGSRCQTRTKKTYCESQQGDCKHIAKCDPNATCKKKENVGKYRQYWQCECNKGWSGNGIQCMDGNGTLSSMPWQQVEVTANVTVGLYNDTHVENEFNHGEALEVHALGRLVRPPMRSLRSNNNEKKK